MNTLELVTYLRENILDDTGGMGVDWASLSENDFDSNQLRWSNESLVRNINEAINQVYRRINPIKDVVDLDIVSGESEYSIPSYIENILLVKDGKGKSLTELEMVEKWWKVDLDSFSDEPESYFPDFKTRTIKIYPLPQKDDTLKLLVYRYPITPLTWDNNEASPELEEKFQLPMLWYAAFLSYSKDEANTYDPRRATQFMSYFDREFPFTSAYSNVRKQRTRNRPIKYGGL